MSMILPVLPQAQANALAALSSNQLSALVSTLPIYEGTWAGLLASFPANANAGKRAVVTDFVSRPVVVSDGANWRPLNGRMRLYGRNGTVAAPLASFTGVTAGYFTLPQTLTIPAGIVAPHSEVWANFDIYKTGAGGTAGISMRLGTTGGATDGVFGSGTAAAASGQTVRLYSGARFSAATDRFLSTGYAAFNGGGSSVSSAFDRTTGVSTTASMVISLELSAANVADTIMLLGYSVWLEG